MASDSGKKLHIQTFVDKNLAKKIDKHSKLCVNSSDQIHVDVHVGQLACLLFSH